MCTDIFYSNAYEEQNGAIIQLHEMIEEGEAPVYWFSIGFTSKGYRPGETVIMFAEGAEVYSECLHCTFRRAYDVITVMGYDGALFEAIMMFDENGELLRELTVSMFMKVLCDETITDIATQEGVDNLITGTGECLLKIPGAEGECAELYYIQNNAMEHDTEMDSLQSLTSIQMLGARNMVIDILEASGYDVVDACTAANGNDAHIIAEKDGAEYSFTMYAV